MLVTTNRTYEFVLCIGKEVIKQRALRLNVWDSMTITSKVSRKENPYFKDNLIEYYGCRHCTNTDLIKCMVLNEFLPRKLVSASHIFPVSTRGSGLDEYNLQSEDLWNVRNGLLLYKPIEVLFDRMECCFLYNPINTSIYLKILNPALHLQRVWTDTEESLIPIDKRNCTLNFGDIDNFQLQLPSSSSPFKRLLHQHAKLSVKRAVEKKWVKQEVADQFATVFALSEGAMLPEDMDNMLEQDELCKS